MKIEPKNLKGFRDFLPSEMRKRQYVINTLKSVFESYGFEPLETPALEYADILTGKYGTEGDKLMYRFKDNGDRDVAMRYDQTVPLARVVAQYGSTGSPQALPIPFKRYQIQNVWRAENTQKGRYREFLQCDIDTVGTESASANSEIIECISKALETLGFEKFRITLNDRANFKDIPNEAITIIDKLKKIGEDNVRKELKEKGFDDNLLENLRNEQTPESVEKIISSFSLSTTSSQLTYDPTLARGLDYYTGLIFEVEVEGYSAGSVAGGGRFDELIGMFEDKKIPAIGGSFGFDRLLEAMDELNLFPENLTTSKVLIINEQDKEEAIKIANNLRDEGINTEVYLDSTVKKSKQLNYADKKGIPYTLSLKEDGLYELGWKEDNKINKKTLTFEKLLEELDK